MIRYLCSSQEFKNPLLEIMDVDIEVINQREGIITSEVPIDLQTLGLFTQMMAQDYGIILTCLDCHAQDALSTACLAYAHRLKPSSVHRLSQILLVVLMHQEQSVIDEIQQWLSQLSTSQLEFGKTFVESDGNNALAAKRLYVHRNTISNRLNEFEAQTKLDLRNHDYRKAFEIMITYQSYR